MPAHFAPILTYLNPLVKYFLARISFILKT